MIAWRLCENFACSSNGVSPNVSARPAGVNTEFQLVAR